MKVRNWPRWQSYRRDRGQPPWIKVWRCLMRNEDWVALNDAQRGQLVSMWILAADNNGKLPDDPRTIKKLCYLKNTPNLKVFCDRDFLQYDANVASRRRQHDAKVTPRRRQRDATDTEADPYIPSGHTEGGPCIPSGVTDSVLGTDTTLSITSNGAQQGLSWGQVTEQVRLRDGFAIFWNDYPKKRGKEAAWRAWVRHKPPLDAVLENLRWQKVSAQWTRNAGEFIPYPQKYLNEQRWLDEPDPPPPESVNHEAFAQWLENERRKNGSESHDAGGGTQPPRKSLPPGKAVGGDD